MKRGEAGRWCYMKSDVNMMSDNSPLADIHAHVYPSLTHIKYLTYI